MGKEKRQKEEKPGKRKKKSHRLYALVVLLLGIAIIALGVLILFYVQKIEISGNEYCTDQEIALIRCIFWENTRWDTESSSHVWRAWKLDLRLLGYSRSQ